MKCKVRNSIAIALGALMAVMMFVLTAPAQHPKRKPIADIGVTLGPNQILRLVGDWNGDGVADIQFRQAVYVQGGVNNGVYKLMLTSQSTSQTVTLMPGEAASIDIPSNGFGVRAIVLSDKPDLHVNAMIVDAPTGNIIGMLVGG